MIEIAVHFLIDFSVAGRCDLLGTATPPS